MVNAEDRKDSGRETFRSSWGVVLTTAGAAIGLGNIWRFPYMMGLFGGGAFLLVYLGVVILFGIPGLMVEWTLGRETRRGPLGAFQLAGLPGGKLWGYLLILTVTMAASYYAVVIAWVLHYFLYYVLRGGAGMDAAAHFEALTADAIAQALPLIATVALGCGSMYFGVRRGIERISKLVTPLFFILTAVLVVRALTLPGAWEGVRFYLVPRWDQFSGLTLLAATGQAYFSLALGGTFMVVYGSYMSSRQDIPRTAVGTALADAGAAFIAGLVVVPSVFAFDLDMAGGPPLLFVVMPQVFAEMPLGSWFGTLFFLSVFLVALLSLVAAYEVMVAAFLDYFGWTRKQALGTIFLLEVLLAIPAMVSLNYLFYSDLLWGSTMQPVGAVISVFALTWCASRSRALKSMSDGARRPLPPALYYWVKYVIPPTILGALVYGLVSA